MDLYLTLAKRWGTAIDAKDSYFLSITKDHLSKGWTAIAFHLKLTRQILEEDDKGRDWSNLLNELVQAQDLWNNEDKDYRSKIDNYKEVLNKYEDILRDSRQKIDDLNQQVQDIKMLEMKRRY